jgi:hypothetical protein
MRHAMTKKCGELSNLAAAEGIEGLEGTAPITVEPLELVFNTDELVLHSIPTQTLVRLLHFLLKWFYIYIAK